MRTLVALVLCLFVAGCKKPEAAAAPPPALPPGAAQPGSSGITPVGPNVGGMTPVAGTESLGEGTGGGIGQAAKDRARSAAASSSAPPPTGDESTG